MAPVGPVGPVTPVGPVAPVIDVVWGIGDRRVKSMEFPGRPRGLFTVTR